MLQSNRHLCGKQQDVQGGREVERYEEGSGEGVGGNSTAATGALLSRTGEGQ